MARLNYLFEHRRRAGIVLGPSGVGKTALLARFARDIRRAGHDAVLIDLLGTSDGEFLWNVASRLAAAAQPNESRIRLWRAIADRLFENRLLGVQTVMLFDNVDDANPDVLTLITRLLRCENSPESALTCALSAKAGNLCRLGTNLLELIDLRIDLEEWSMAETVKFLENQPAAADNAACSFTPAALERLHELSAGTPRKILQLADLSHLAATVTAAEHVDPFTVENVYNELSVGGLLSPV